MLTIDINAPTASTFCEEEKNENYEYCTFTELCVDAVQSSAIC